MKTTKYFFMAALALMTAACSNEDNEIEQQPQMARGIPFTAIISMGESAATRALEENSDGYIVGKWEKDDLVALIYKVGENSYKAEAKVTSVSESDGKATLSGELRSDAVNGSEVTIIYPATAADGATGNVKSDVTILTTQDGTLTGNENSLDKTCDVRTGKGKLSISGADGYKTATVNNGTAGTYVQLTNYFAILKFSIQDIGENISAENFKATKFKVTCPNPLLCREFTPGAATGELYVALPNATVLPVGAYWLNATIDNQAYVGKAKVATQTNLEKGKFYSTTVQMATVGDVVLSNGRFAAEGTTTDAVAIIAYVGDGTDDDTYKHGLALAMADETVAGNSEPDEMTWSQAYEVCRDKTPSVADTSGWRLPSKTQWENMIAGTAALTKGLESIMITPNWYFWSFSKNDNLSGSPSNYLDLDNNGSTPIVKTWDNAHNNLSARACIAF